MSQPETRTETPTPHDALFKYVFGEPEQARGLLQSLLPEDFAGRIDWSTLHPESETFVERHLRETRSDLIFSARVDGRSVVVYVLFEHLSTPRDLVPFQMLGYEVGIWKKHLRANPDAQRIPAILPIVVYHGERAWTGPRSFHEIVDLPPELLGTIGGQLPAFELVLFDITEITDDELRGRALLGALGRLALLCLSRARTSPDVIGELGRFFDVAMAVLAAPKGVAALAAILSYILQVADVEPERVQELFRRLGPRGEEAYMTGAQKLKEEGRAEGRAEVLIKQLELKLGAVPEHIAERIRRARADEIDRWVERVLTATSPQDVLDE